MGESGITCNTRFMAHAFGNETFNYEFSVPPAMHVQDVQFTFFGGPNEVTTNLGLAIIPSVALWLQGYITSFVKTGNPNGGSRPGFPQYGKNSSICWWVGQMIGRQRWMNWRVRGVGGGRKLIMRSEVVNQWTVSNGTDGT